MVDHMVGAISNQKVASGIIKDVGVKFFPATGSSLAGAPVIPNGRITVVGIRPVELIIVASVQVCGEHQLLGVVHAEDALRFRFGFGESGQQHSGENGNDGNHHQKLDQCETAKGSCPPAMTGQGCRLDGHKV